jgi:multidrug efflux pump subunit AcrA (membrane-fusion protein)
MRIQIAAGVLAILALMGMFLPYLIHGPKVPVQTVQKQSFVQTVVASGRVENAHRIDVGVQLTGTVKAVPVNEGQRVTQGMVLIQIDSAELQAALRQAELAEQQARAQVRQIKDLHEPMAEQELGTYHLAVPAQPVVLVVRLVRHTISFLWRIFREIRRASFPPAPTLVVPHLLPGKGHVNLLVIWAVNLA